MSSCRGKWATTRDKARKCALPLSLHGIPDLAGARGPVGCMFWIVVLIFSMSMMCRSVAHIITDFWMQPTLSKVSTLSPEYFPPLTICPAQWIDHESAKRSGFSSEEIALLKQYLQTTYNIPESGTVHNLTDKLRSFNGSYDDIINVSAITKDFLRCSASLVDFEDFVCSVYEIIVDLSLCFVVNVTTAFGPNQLDYVKIHVGFKAKIWSSEEQQLAVTVQPLASLAYSPQAQVIVKSGDKLQVGLEFRRVKRVSTRVKPCRRYSMGEKTNCVFKMWNSMCRRMGLKQTYLPGFGVRFDETDLLGKPCAFNASHERQLMRRLAHEGRCHVPCVQDSFRVVVNSANLEVASLNRSDLGVVPGSNASQSWLELYYADHINSLDIEERLVYSGDVLVGSLGGQISLWTGASLVTLWQIAYCMAVGGQIAAVDHSNV